jgi:hypothetical protein
MTDDEIRELLEAANPHRGCSSCGQVIGDLSHALHTTAKQDRMRIRDLEARLERAEKVVEIARTQRESAGGNGPFEFGYACSRTHAAVAALDANSKGIP